jgi:hypothetical protein
MATEIAMMSTGRVGRYVRQYYSNGVSFEEFQRLIKGGGNE